MGLITFHHTFECRCYLYNGIEWQLSVRVFFFFFKTVYGGEREVRGLGSSVIKHPHERKRLWFASHYIAVVFPMNLWCQAFFMTSRLTWLKNPLKMEKYLPAQWGIQSILSVYLGVAGHSQRNQLHVYETIVRLASYELLGEKVKDLCEYLMWSFWFLSC